jgi:hypothetical protein
MNLLGGLRKKGIKRHNGEYHQSDIKDFQEKSSDEERLVFLKNVFDEKIYGEYAGGTLTGMLNKKLNFFNVGKGETEEENFWIALNYIKYMSANGKGAHYQDALDIANKDPNQAFIVAKAMLWSQND